MEIGPLYSGRTEAKFVGAQFHTDRARRPCAAPLTAGSLCHTGQTALGACDQFREGAQWKGRGCWATTESVEAVDRPRLLEIDAHALLRVRSRLHPQKNS